MALSQVQCLDDNHVNWRSNESKPDFFYSEDQRLALEALIKDGREAFEEYIKNHKVRQFLSELELEQLSRTAEIYNPGTDQSTGQQDGESEDEIVSLQYWPERSDTSIPDLDLGWPDCASYRGVTRVNVYTQPPMEGQSHIKEVVRKTIAQAQKVIAIVMDLFTDVDIFKDLLDASFKRKVAVYIILESTGVPHFLSMCERAAMHRGHLKNLRVRSTSGTEFYTRMSTKVRGSMSQKFMFVDGDRAVSGSYSFTWTASRLDRNLITALTGQAVDSFDKLFRELYLTSRGVNLSKINLEDEPQPEPIPQSAPAPPPSAAIARKLINPKYALVSSNSLETGSRTSSDKNSAKNSNSHHPMVKVPRRPKEAVEPPPLHPGLVDMERAHMISYLPTWPEPDPPSDVIGFINIRDSSKRMQAHLMRSELFETSQAIRFKDPFVSQEEPLPEKACLRQRSQNICPHPPEGQQKQQSKPELQTMADEATGSIKPLDQTHTPENAARNMDTPLLPVPKPRTVQLVSSPEDSNLFRMVQKTDKEVETPPTPQGHGPDHTTDPTAEKRTDLSDHNPTTVTQPCKALSQDGGHVDADKELRRSKQKDDGVTEDNHEGTNTESQRKDSIVSAASEEYFECNDSDALESRHQLMVNGMHGGSGRLEDHRPSDGLNVMARFSQSMLDLRPENQEPEDQQTPGLERAEREKLASAPVYKIISDREGQGRIGAKVVIAKPGSYHRPVKAAGPVIGGHKYWNNKLYNQHRSASGRSSPSKQTQAQFGRYKTGQFSALPRPTPTKEDICSPYGIPLSRLSQFKHLRGKILGSPLNSLQKPAQLGHKGAV